MIDNCIANWPLILEFLKVLLSWPPIVGLLVIIAFIAFHTRISEAIQRVRRIAGMGVTADLDEQKSATPLLPASAANMTSSVADVNAAIAENDAFTASLPQDTRSGQVDFVATNPTLAKSELLKWFAISKLEETLNRIYGTQYRALEEIESAGITGVDFAFLRPFHDQHEALAKGGGQHPASFENFVQFFVETALVQTPAVQGTQRVIVTPFGRQFLKYTKARYPAWLRSRNW